jgi:gliding motility-associated-like protein
MLVVNGAEVLDQSIWCQTVTVVPHMTYAFSAWLASATALSPAILDFTVNGVSLGSPLNAPSGTGIWAQFTAVWNSGTATTATICITNLNPAENGNDFALDDIVFSPFCIYTDSVTVTVNPVPAPDLGPDISACAGDSVVLEPVWPGAQSYLWPDGSTESSFVATASGIYWVDITTDGCTGRDSITVTINPLPVVDLGPDQDLCQGGSTTLSAAQPGASYVWQDGSTGATFTTGSSDTASVTVTVLGCVSSDTVNIVVYPLPVTDLGPDALICPDSLLQFHAAQPGGSYLWDDGDTLPDHVVGAEGPHWLAITVNGCSTSDTMVVRHVLPIDLDLGPGFILCTGTTATLDAGEQPGPDLHYLWDNGSTGPTREIDDGGLYTVRVTNSCGMARDSIQVTKDQCNCPVFVPNAFTPDGDGINDTFAPVLDCATSDYRLSVFDRWGQMIWSSDDPQAAWDGTAGGDPPHTGVYEWTLEIATRTVYDSFPRRLVGHVTVMP